jgi:hypothetical protein
MQTFNPKNGTSRKCKNWNETSEFSLELWMHIHPVENWNWVRALSRITVSDIAPLIILSVNSPAMPLTPEFDDRILSWIIYLAQSYDPVASRYSHCQWVFVFRRTALRVLKARFEEQVKDPYLTNLAINILFVVATWIYPAWWIQQHGIRQKGPLEMPGACTLIGLKTN